MRVKNSYLVTVLIFAAILFVGLRFLHWGEISSAFLLLIFFLMVIGIRLDDIDKRIGATNERLDRLLKIQTECTAGGAKPVVGQSVAPDPSASVLITGDPPVSVNNSTR